MSFNAIPLDNLPAPSAVEELSYEVLKQQWLDALIVKYPDAEGLLASDPLYKLVEVGAYREFLWRNRVNEQLKQSMLAFATDSNLDHHAASFNIERKTLIAATEETPAVYESDEELRTRVQLSNERRSTAGPRGQYISHTLDSHVDVLDAWAYKLNPGIVSVIVLSRVGDGAASSELLNAVTTYLNTEERRPMTDDIEVHSAEIKTYSIHAKVYLMAGPDPVPVLNLIQSNVEKYTKESHRLGFRVALSGIYSGIHIAGVERVELEGLDADIECTDLQAPYCTDITIEPIYA
ncbi:baseplate assembly protein [Piscirickettsia litoralis]|uniref:Baseplate J-like central domain-containing protein n=1 Tax=Piscirickettsia litoralis TaxID=1891921 RepID=A0ABX2ZY58_9GAMM|nr:baseplate J/gp47 family protein [Piscirickettsia litoralis]ODN41554.1 hypothetical protein BGC07_15715 [Piscirickettsia litoralis]